jgi:hypothetical protein
MIRPVFKAGMESVWLTVDEQGEPSNTQNSLTLYPNPSADGRMTVDWPASGPWVLYDMNGRKCAEGLAQGSGPALLDLSSSAPHSPGMYILHHLTTGASARLQLGAGW